MSVTQLPETMDAIVFKQPYKVAVEQVPTPKLQTEGDVIIKVHLAGLCGVSSRDLQRMESWI